MFTLGLKAVNQDGDESANSSEVDSEQEASQGSDDDQEFIAYQKARQTPKVQLTYTGDGEEEVVLEIDDFSQLNDKVHGQMGLLSDEHEK